jgi:hypothetical protein
MAELADAGDLKGAQQPCSTPRHRVYPLVFNAGARLETIKPMESGHEQGTTANLVHSAAIAH